MMAFVSVVCAVGGHQELSAWDEVLADESPNSSEYVREFTSPGLVGRAAKIRIQATRMRAVTVNDVRLPVINESLAENMVMLQNRNVVKLVLKDETDQYVRIDCSPQ